MLLSAPPPLPTTPHGVFVTGTDTGIGKTFISALLTHAWHGTYWKPLQTGLSDEPGDTETITHLTGLPTSHIIPPAYALQASLSPADASVKEGALLTPTALTLPPRTQTPLIIEGAGGLMVPITPDYMMIDLIAQLGLPVILVTRSGLGTLNHTLLSLEALYQRCIPVLGFITNGPDVPQNRSTLERISHTPALCHIPALPHAPTAKDVQQLSNLIPSWQTLTA